MASTETAIHWMELRRGKVSYSMASRNGSSSFDSSSAVYYALQAGELLPVSTNVGNTDTLFDDLADNSWTITDSGPVRGDVALLGVKGYSSGDAGVAVIFIDATRVIHCSRAANTITIDTYSVLLSALGNPPATIYHSSDNDSGTPTSLTNVGELEYLGIRQGRIHAEGWHFSSDRPYESIQFINAETDAVIATVQATLTEREDIAEGYPEVPGVGLSGFDVSTTVPNGTAVYIKGIRSANSGASGDELVFSKIIIYEQAVDVDEDLYAVYNRDTWFEILDGDDVLVRGKDLLDLVSWETELMYVPTATLVLPITYAQYIAGREEVKIFVNQKVFHGLVLGHETSQTSESIILHLRHVAEEWTFRQLSTNLAIKNQTINDIYSTLDFRYEGWNMEYLQDSATRIIDYVYSRQNKLEGLTKTCELTEDLYWRVSFDFGRKMQIGAFGEEKPYTISQLPSTDTNIHIIEGPSVVYEYDQVINIATVYGEKSDSGMSSMSLREVYADEGSQDPRFPVVILRNGINNERNYDYVEFTKLAPNNEIEYSVLDLDSIDVESGIVVEGTFSFNDLAPFAIEGEEVTDEDRAKASLTAYEAAVKALKNSRRRVIFDMRTEELPADLNVGDKVHFLLDITHFDLTECSDRFIEVLSENDWFYITRIGYDFDTNGTETNTVRLEKFLQTEREAEVQ